MVAKKTQNGVRRGGNTLRPFFLPVLMPGLSGCRQSGLGQLVKAHHCICFFSEAEQVRGGSAHV